MTGESKPAPFGDRELDIMQVLWTADRAATVAEVHRALNAAGADLAYTTVQTILNRLEKKGRLVRETGGVAHRYRTVVAHETAAGNAVDRLLTRFFGGSAEALASHLVGRGLDQGELERVRRLIDVANQDEKP